MFWILFLFGIFLMGMPIAFALGFNNVAWTVWHVTSA